MINSAFNIAAAALIAIAAIAGSVAAVEVPAAPVTQNG